MTSMIRAMASQTGTQAVAQAVHTGAMLVVVPILLNTLGPTRLGLWFTALSMLALLGFIVPALGGAVTNAVARASQADHISAIASSALALVLTGWLALVPLALVIAWAVPWDVLFGNGDQIADVEIAPLIFTVIASLGLAAAAQVPRSVLIGCTRGELAFGIDALAALFAALTLVAAAIGGQPLWVLALAYTGLRSAINFLAGLWIMRRACAVGVHFGAVRGRLAHSLAREAGGLSVSGAAYSAAHHTDTLLISTFSTLGGTAIYGMVARLFALPAMLVSFVTLAFWPHAAQAHAGHQDGLLRRHFAFVLAGCVTFAVICAAALSLALEPILKFWTGRSVTVDTALVTGFLAWTLVASVMVPLADLYRAQRRLHLLARLNIAVAIVNLPLSIALITAMGPAGAVWASAIATTLCFLLPAARVGLMGPRREQPGAAVAQTRSPLRRVGAAP